MTSKHYSLLLASCIALVACAGENRDDRYAQADQALAEAGENLEGEGPCATVDQVPVDCPASVVWRNHGQYVSCVAKYVDARVEAGDINVTDAEALVREAAQSTVGKPVQATQHDAAKQDDGDAADTDQSEDAEVADDDQGEDEVADDDQGEDEEDEAADDNQSEEADPDYVSALTKDRC